MEVLSKNFDFKKKFQELSHNTGLNYETGYFFSKNGTSYNFTYIQGLANDPEINFSISGPIDGFIHSHYTGTYSLFSGVDIKTMYTTYQYGMMNNPLSFSIGVTTPQGNSYMVGIEDISMFLSFSSANFSSQSSFNSLEEFYENNFIAFTVYGKTEEEARELAFFETFANSGLQLFKGNSDFSQFKRITKNNNQVNSQNCN
jgi:hypothetical protein